MDVVITGTAVASPVLRHPSDILADRVVADTGFDPAAQLGGRGFRYKDRSTLLSLLAAARALADASLVEGAPPAAVYAMPGVSVGVVASSNLGNLDTVCRTVDRIASRSVIGTSPMDLPNASSNVIASSVAVMFGLRGPNVMICNGESSGLDAVWMAAMLIASGRAAAVVVVGAEPVNDVVRRLTEPDTTHLFDGAAAAVLESGSGAAARGAGVRARLGLYARRARPLEHHPRPGLRLTADLQAVLGRASGALGVLQVVAAAQWLDSGRPGPVLAIAGDAADGVSSLLLTGRMAET